MSFAVGIRVILVVVLAGLGACRTAGHITPSTVPAIVTDARRYTVRSFEEGYSTTIEWQFRNTTGVLLTKPCCAGLPPPVLEKKVDGHWVVAYRAIVMGVSTTAFFYIMPDSVYRHKYSIVAGKRGSQFHPQFTIDSIPGTYRLRWFLTVGSPPSSDAPTIQPLSNEFDLVVQ